LNDYITMNLGDSQDHTENLSSLSSLPARHFASAVAGRYPALRLGPPWWFFDSISGMTRYRDLVHETARLSR